MDYLAHKQSDIQWTAACNRLTSPAAGSHAAVRIPARSLVKNIYLVKLTAYASASATIMVGFNGNGETADPDAFLKSADIDPDSTGVVSMQHDGTGVEAAGKYFDLGGLITVDTADGGGAAGTFQLFVDYVQLTN